MHDSQPAASNTNSNPKHDDSETELITLSRAAKDAPGRPSCNAIWRWCRRGVLARSGERVRMEHVRIGGKIFTKGVWVREFGERLAAADTQYFANRMQPSAPAGTCGPRQRQLDVEAELREAGL